MAKNKIEVLVEEHVSKILLEIFGPAEPGELNVYDFDDTLVKTDGTIRLINKKTGERKELAPHEFHEYQLSDDEDFDLTGFNVLTNPVKLPHLKKMKNDYTRLGKYGVSVCTARPSANEVIDFLAAEGMPDIEVVAVGVFNPKGNLTKINATNKQNYVRSKIKQRKLRVLNFYDDNIANCNAIEKLKDEFPTVKIGVEKV